MPAVRLAFNPQSDFAYSAGSSVLNGPWINLEIKVPLDYYRRKLYCVFRNESGVGTWQIIGDICFYRAGRFLTSIPYCRYRPVPAGARSQFYPVDGTATSDGIQVYLGNTPTLFILMPFEVIIGCDKITFEIKEQTYAASASYQCWCLACLSSHVW